MSNKVNLRKKSVFISLIKPTLMSKRQLPTHNDVIKHFYYLNGHSEDTKAIKTQTIDEVIAIWKSASLPTVPSRSILRKLEKDLVTIKNMRKNELHPSFPRNWHLHTTKKNVLFEISTCTCKSKCECTNKLFKIPMKELEFLKDQRCERRMFIETSIVRNTTIQSRIRVEPTPSTLVQFKAYYCKNNYQFY